MTVVLAVAVGLSSAWCLVLAIALMRVLLAAARAEGRRERQSRPETPPESP